MTDIVITEFLEPGAVKVLERDYRVLWDRDLWNKRKELETLVRDIPALIVRNRTRVDKALLDLAPNLKVVGRLGVGLDNIDVAECKARGIEICAARGANANSVSEYVIAMAMTLLRGAAYTSSARLVTGQWPREELGKGAELAGKVLGIIGLGSIGATSARKASALDMRVIAFDPNLPEAHENWKLARKVALNELIGTADVITLHCELSKETRGLMGKEALARMKKGAILINSARGGIVDEAACAAGLKSGHLGGAALDVFDDEPIKADVGKLFAGIPNVILTPHISGVTLEANSRVSFMTVESVVQVLKRTR
ncbi:MAG: hydroxyacid dehydrogenase [Hyphomicrobiaceae bacterium]|nr:MAG: hydroxyacid dehydrogenase [Hyphomicrobiaceae bacterium]